VRFKICLRLIVIYLNSSLYFGFALPQFHYYYYKYSVNIIFYILESVLIKRRSRRKKKNGDVKFVLVLDATADTWHLL
jgi:hypothetical protein